MRHNPIAAPSAALAEGTEVKSAAKGELMAEKDNVRARRADVATLPTRSNILSIPLLLLLWFLLIFGLVLSSKRLTSCFATWSFVEMPMMEDDARELMDG